MKHLIVLFVALGGCATTPAPTPSPAERLPPIFQLDCVYIPPGGNVCLPEPPAGGRKCDSRGNPTINSGEFAVYTAPNYDVANGWCITLPGGYYPNMGMMQGFQVKSIKNMRTGWPVPPVSIGYSGANYTGSTMSLPNGSYPSLSFSPASLKVN